MVQLLPPRFNQVQPTSVLEQKLDLDLEPGSQRQSDFPTGMDNQIILSENIYFNRSICS
jgi:hypothetical protein